MNAPISRYRRRTLAVHADWSADSRKRWMTLASGGPSGWRVGPPEPVGEVSTLIGRLLARADGAPVALGLDAPLGVPRAFAANLSDADFPAFLRRIGSDRDFFVVARVLGEVTTARPFYPARGERGMSRAAHAEALGFADAAGLSRACDRATAERPSGAPPFWTLGANQTGKAAIIVWRDLLAPALRDGEPIRLWPFQGPLQTLLAPGVVAVAETYPAEAMRHLGIRLRGSKRRQADRAAVAPALELAMARLGATPAEALVAAAVHGFGADSAAEDRFDSLLGVLCVLGVLGGLRPDTAPSDPAIQRWEGWVLGQTALPRAAGGEPLRSRLVSRDSSARRGAPGQACPVQGGNE